MKKPRLYFFSLQTSLITTQYPYKFIIYQRVILTIFLNQKGDFLVSWVRMRDMVACAAIGNCSDWKSVHWLVRVRLSCNN